MSLHDMLLGALVDAGASPEEIAFLERAVQSALSRVHGEAAILEAQIATLQGQRNALEPSIEAATTLADKLALSTGGSSPEEQGPP